ncbi:MAG TPA: class I SAM-dependent methyltransferase [Thermoleophilaceae bacterium]|nr:class I SAM-dependent methyltransferase [Thermoleophilaceae bacterium]
MKGDLYDEIGVSYRATREEDPRLAAAIWSALGDAQSVLNVGAGAGAYEPPDREVTAVEPSEVMIAQRREGAAPVARASAEELPFPDNSFDAAMAVLTDHHWRDRRQGLRELRRVARQRVVLFNADPAQAGRFWLTREYLPAFLSLIPDRYREVPDSWTLWFAEVLGGKLRVAPFPIPHDCRDGFYGAFWRRPEAYLDPEVRNGISIFSLLDARDVEAALARLRGDLESGRWRQRHAALLGLSELDLGYAVVQVDLTPAPRLYPGTPPTGG